MGISKPLYLVRVLFCMTDRCLLDDQSSATMLCFFYKVPIHHFRSTSVLCFHLMAAVGSHFKCMFQTSIFHIHLDILHACASLLL